MLLDMFICTPGGNSFRPVFSRRSYKYIKAVFKITLDVLASNLILHSSQPSFYNLDYGPLNTHPSNRGSILKGNYSHTLDVLYLRVFNNNPRTRALYVVDQIDESAIKSLLIIGYEKYKFFEIAIMSRITRFNQSTGKNETKVLFCSFDPFIEDMPLFCKNLTSGSVYQEIKEIRSFMIDRMNNFHGYPLKVSIFFIESRGLKFYEHTVL
jgi:hypothetical protein